MVLFKHARDFFWISVLWRNYKVQVVARGGRKSAVVLSGTMEASYPRFFIGIDFNRFSRIHFPPLRSKGGKSILEKTVRRSSENLEEVPRIWEGESPGGPKIMNPSNNDYWVITLLSFDL